MPVETNSESGAAKELEAYWVGDLRIFFSRILGGYVIEYVDDTGTGRLLRPREIFIDAPLRGNFAGFETTAQITQDGDTVYIDRLGASNFNRQQFGQEFSDLRSALPRKISSPNSTQAGVGGVGVRDEDAPTAGAATQADGRITTPGIPCAGE